MLSDESPPAELKELFDRWRGFIAINSRRSRNKFSDWATMLFQWLLVHHHDFGVSWRSWLEDGDKSVVHAPPRQQHEHEADSDEGAKEVPARCDRVLVSLV